MTQGYFITGTDTGVGKTIVTASLALALQKTGKRVVVFKPIESGTAEGAGDVEFYKNHAIPIVNSYSFRAPLAPLVAARLEKNEISFEKISQDFEQLKSKVDFILVEGAGGLLVPLTPQKTVLDLVALFKLPAVVVAKQGLGTLNHTLMTLEILQQHRLPIAGVIFKALSQSLDESALSNEAILKEFTKVPVLGVVPYFENIDRDVILTPDFDPGEGSSNSSAIFQFICK